MQISEEGLESLSEVRREAPWGTSSRVTVPGLPKPFRDAAMPPMSQMLVTGPQHLVFALLNSCPALVDPFLLFSCSFHREHSPCATVVWDSVLCLNFTGAHT